MTPPVEARRLTRRYGTLTAVDDLDLRVDAGEVYGFLGPNGAGRTTTPRMLLGLVRPSSGVVRLFGRPPGRLDGVEAPIRVVIADDQDLIRLGLRTLLTSEDDMTVAGEAADGPAAVEQTRAHHPDVVLMDGCPPATAPSRWCSHTRPAWSIDHSRIPRRLEACGGSSTTPGAVTDPSRRAGHGPRPNRP